MDGGLALWGAAGGSCAGIVHWVYQPAHQATAWLRVSVNTPYIAFPMREDTRQFLETQLELMRSPLVLGPVISQPEIAQVPEIRDREAPIVWLGTKIKAASVGQSELVQVSFEARNPADAARVVNAIVDTYLDFRGRDNSEQVQRVVELLEEEKARRMHEVNLMRDTIRELAKQATGKDPFAPKSRNDTAAIHPLADLQARLVNAEVERQILEARVKAFGESLAKPAEVSEAKLDQAVEQHPNVQALRAELLEKKSRLQDYERTLVQGVKIPVTCGWTSKFAATNRAYKRPARDCDSIRKELAEKLNGERKDELAKLRNTLNDSRVVEQLLRDRNKSLLKEAKEATGDTLQLEFKQAELARAEKVLGLIAERALQLRTEQRAPAKIALLQKADDRTTIVDRAGYQKQIALATLAGLCLPLLLVVSWEWLARRVSNAEQIEVHARLPVLGEIARLPVRFDRAGRLVAARGKRPGAFRGERGQSADLSGAFRSASRHAGAGDHQRLEQRRKDQHCPATGGEHCPGLRPTGSADRRRHAVARHSPSVADAAGTGDGGSPQPPMFGAGRDRDGLEQLCPRHARRQARFQSTQASRQRGLEGVVG